MNDQVSGRELDLVGAAQGYHCAVRAFDSLGSDCAWLAAGQAEGCDGAAGGDYGCCHGLEDAQFSDRAVAAWPVALAS